MVYSMTKKEFYDRIKTKMSHSGGERSQKTKTSHRCSSLPVAESMTVDLSLLMESVVFQLLSNAFEKKENCKVKPLIISHVCT